MSQQLLSSISPVPPISSVCSAARTRTRVIAVIRDHLERGDLRRAGAHAYYWSQRLDTHPYLEPVVGRAFDAIRRAQLGEPWQARR